MNVKARCGTPSSRSSPVGARVRVLSAVYRGGGYNVCTPSRGEKKKNDSPLLLQDEREYFFYKPTLPAQVIL